MTTFKVKKYSRSIIIFLIAFLIYSPNIAKSQYYDTTGKSDAVVCRAGRDYSTFMSSIISYDGFYEYWKDIIIRYNYNYCLYQDIDSLYQRVSKVRKSIRNAFYRCADTTEIERLKKTYYELETKLYFLRKYIDVSSGNFIVKKDEDIIADFEGLFVFNRGMFTNDVVMELFNDFKKQYEPRIPIYQDCEDVSWQMVLDKWNEFKNTAGGITPALEEAKKSTTKRWDRLSNSAKNFGSEFISEIIDFKINGLPAKEGWGQIAEELKRNSPSGFTFETYKATVNRKSAENDYQRLQAEYEAQYEILYKESSDEYTRQIDNKLKQLDDIIIDSFPYQNQTIHCVKDIKDKQC